MHKNCLFAKVTDMGIMPLHIFNVNIKNIVS